MAIRIAHWGTGGTGRQGFAASSVIRGWNLSASWSSGRKTQDATPEKSSA